MGRQRGGKKDPDCTAEQKGEAESKDAVSTAHTFEAEGEGVLCGVVERRPGTKWPWRWGVTAPTSLLTGRVEQAASGENGLLLTGEDEQATLVCQSGYQRSLLDGL